MTPHDIVLEPEGRDTAPAIAVAAIEALRHDDDALLLALPSDIEMGDEDDLERLDDIYGRDTGNGRK